MKKSKTKTSKESAIKPLSTIRPFSKFAKIRDSRMKGFLSIFVKLLFLFALPMIVVLDLVFWKYLSIIIPIEVAIVVIALILALMVQRAIEEEKEKKKK